MDHRLLLDAMLGKLATYLRMCGYDAAYVLDGIDDPTAGPTDDEVIARGRRSDRTVLTRDRELAACADDAILLRSREVVDQLSELRAAGYDLSLDATPTRCGACNGPVDAVDPGESGPPYAPDPADTDCFRCQECERVFWKGGHWDDVRATLTSL
ncbi:hypothetical protein GCM10008995_13160 [Halobellus salinus]|uniref:Mut7-C RNAse domain-containing protein n=1 Tax=Halobellus salinus TaxID=931585 RepID=A0A830E9Y2_9EURY|nr:Mut7-C RNAse domain-containing protein [Halobellus salinus]GGJ04690.1 hypothetical protein GCM10008995_13160 [Halobellus salinus]SMP09221.1 hypothetical protein SAMN06265347_10392 [Halobellus salinus]